MDNAPFSLVRCRLLIQIHLELVLELKSNYESMIEKTSKQQILAMETNLPRNQMFFFHTPLKLLVLQ